MYLVGALVGVDRFQVVHVADHRILEGDAVRPEHAACFPSHLQGRADVHHLAEAHLLSGQRSCISFSAEMHGQQRRLIDLHHHFDQFLLGELE